MKRVSVLILLVAFSTYAMATSMEDLYGTWTIVKSFSDDADIYGKEVMCTKFNFNPSTNACTCNGDVLASYSVAVGTIDLLTLHGYIKDTHEEAINFARKPCNAACGGGYKVFRKLGNNYLIMYFSASSNKVPDLALFAKAVPSSIDLDTVIGQIKGFEDKVNATMCTSDMSVNARP